MKFFLIDRVERLAAGEEAEGLKNLSLSDEVFFDQFPGHPTYPGSLQIESMAQLAGLLAEASYHAQYPDTRRAVLLQVEQAKFHQPCVPGDQLVVRARLASLLSAAARVEAGIWVRERCVAAATLTFRLVAVDTPAVHQQRLELYTLWTQHLSPRPQLR